MNLQRLLISSITFGRCLEVALQLGRFFCGMLCLERYASARGAGLKFVLNGRKEERNHPFSIRF